MEAANVDARAGGQRAHSNAAAPQRDRCPELDAPFGDRTILLRDLDQERAVRIDQTKLLDLALIDTSFELSNSANECCARAFKTAVASKITATMRVAIGCMRLPPRSVTCGPPYARERARATRMASAVLKEAVAGDHHGRFGHGELRHLFGGCCVIPRAVSSVSRELNWTRCTAAP